MPTDDPYEDILNIAAGSAPKPKPAPQPVQSRLPDLISFADKNKLRRVGDSVSGVIPTSGHNRGSKHYSGNAIDLAPDTDFNAVSKLAAASGFRLRNERTRPKGQKVWGGPHDHLEVDDAPQADPYKDILKIAQGQPSGQVNPPKQRVQKPTALPQPAPIQPTDDGQWGEPAPQGRGTGDLRRILGAEERIEKDTGGGRLRKLDEPALKIQQQLEARDPLQAKLAPRMMAKEASRQLREQESVQATQRHNEPAIQELTRQYRSQIRAGGNKWLSEAVAKMAAAGTDVLAAGTRGVYGAKAGDEIANQAEALERAAKEEGAGRDWKSQLAQDVGASVITTLPELIAMRMGVKAPIAFGAGGAIKRFGRTGSLAETVKAGTESAVGAAPFELPVPKVAEKVLKSAFGERLGRALGRGGTVAAGTTGLGIAERKPPEEIAKNVIANTIMAGGPELLQSKPRSPLERRLADIKTTEEARDVGEPFTPPLRGQVPTPEQVEAGPRQSSLPPAEVARPVEERPAVPEAAQQTPEERGAAYVADARRKMAEMEAAEAARQQPAPVAAQPVPTAVGEPSPTESAVKPVAPEQGLPEWTRQNLDTITAGVEKSGVADKIEELAAQRKTAGDIAKKLGIDRDLVRAVRAKRGIPSLEERPEFEAWLAKRTPVAPEVAKPTEVEIPTPKSERETKIARVRELKPELDALAAKGDLTTPEAKRFEELTGEVLSLRYDLAKPLDLSKLPSESERQSTLPASIVNTAHQDLLQSKPIYTEITNAARGVFFNAETSIDKIMRGQNPEITPQQLYDAFSATREGMRAHYGDTVSLYRATGKQREKPTTNWATTREFAKQFGSRVERREVPIDDIIAVNVGLNGKYHEVIVGKPPKSGARSDVIGTMPGASVQSGGGGTAAQIPETPTPKTPAEVVNERKTTTPEQISTPEGATVSTQAPEAVGSVGAVARKRISRGQQVVQPETIESVTALYEKAKRDIVRLSSKSGLMQSEVNRLRRDLDIGYQNDLKRLRQSTTPETPVVAEQRETVETGGSNEPLKYHTYITRGRAREITGMDQPSGGQLWDKRSQMTSDELRGLLKDQRSNLEDNRQQSRTMRKENADSAVTDRRLGIHHTAFHTKADFADISKRVERQRQTVAEIESLIASKTEAAEQREVAPTTEVVPETPQVRPATFRKYAESQGHTWEDINKPKTAEGRKLLDQLRGEFEALPKTVAPEPTGVVGRYVSKAKAENKAKDEFLAGGGRDFGSGGPDTKYIINKMIIDGYEFYQNAKPKFDAWAKEMRDRFGEVVEPHLRRVYAGITGTREAEIGVESKVEPSTERVVGERQFPKSAVKAGLPQATDVAYEVVGDRAAVDRASARIKNQGGDRVAAELARTKELSKDDVAAASILAHERTAKGDVAGAVDIIDDLAPKLTKAAQTVQAASLISRLSPEGVLLAAQRRFGTEKLPTDVAEGFVAKSKAVRDSENLVSDIQRQYPNIFAPDGSVKPNARLGAPAKSKLATLDERLATMESDARARLAARKSVPKGSQTGASVIPLDIADYAIIGAAKLARKGVTFASWSKDMIGEFGEDIHPHLKDIYRKSFRTLDDERKAIRQESRERAALKAEPNAANVQEVVNRRLDAQTEARKARGNLLAAFEELDASGPQRVLQYAGDVAGVARAAQTSQDVSWGFRQGKMVFTRDALRAFENMFRPKTEREKMIWARAFAKQKSAISEKAYNRVLSEIELDPDFKYAKRGKLELTGVGAEESGRLAARAEEYQTRLISKIPGIKQSERAYNVMGDWAKFHMLKTRLNALRKAGVDLEAPESKQLIQLEAQWINDITGRANLPLGLNRASPIINFFTYSARFWASRLKVLARPLDPRMYSVSEKAGFKPFPKSVRVESWKTLASYYAVVGGQMAAIKAIGAAAGVPVTVGTDPDDPDFLKLKIGDKIHLDLSAGVQGHLRFIAQVLKESYKMSQGQGTQGKLVKIGGRYVRNKLAPIPGFVYDVASGTDFKGDPVYVWGDPKKSGLSRVASSAVTKLITPMLWSDIAESFQALGWGGALGVAAPLATGEGVKVYQPKQRGNPEKERKAVLTGQVRSGKLDEDDLKALVEQEAITEQDMIDIMREGGRTKPQADFAKIKTEEALRRYLLYGESKRDEVRDIMKEKAKNLLKSKDLTPTRREKILDDLERAGIDPNEK